MSSLPRSTPDGRRNNNLHDVEIDSVVSSVPSSIAHVSYGAGHELHTVECHVLKGRPFGRVSSSSPSMLCTPSCSLPTCTTSSPIRGVDCSLPVQTPKVTFARSLQGVVNKRMRTRQRSKSCKRDSQSEYMYLDGGEACPEPD